MRELSYKTVNLYRDEVVTVKDTSNKMAWKFTTRNGTTSEAPGVMFLLLPPDQVAVDTARMLERLRLRVINMCQWFMKHLRMRQNMGHIRFTAGTGTVRSKSRSRSRS